jgi:L-malate glycosyltransferase
LQRFKTNALARAKEFDVAKILPLYEKFYIETIEKFQSKFINA